MIPLRADLGFLTQRRRGLLLWPGPSSPAAHTFTCIVNLQVAINRYIGEHNCRASWPPPITTLTADLRNSELIAKTDLDGATNGARFRAYVTNTSATVLRPGDTVILYNLKARKVTGEREAIEEWVCQVSNFLPTVPISILTNWSPPRRKSSFTRPQHEQQTTLRSPSRGRLPPSDQTNAATISTPLDTMHMIQAERARL